jgi:hypothetical protein
MFSSSGALTAPAGFLAGRGDDAQAGGIFIADEV